MSDNVIDIFSAFATDTKAEQEGVITPLPGCGNTKWKIARANNKHYGKLLSMLYKRNRAALEAKGDEAEALSNKIMAEVYAKTILLSWDKEVKFQGEMLTHSVENAMKLLMLPEFRAMVATVAEDMNNFKAVKDEEDAKN